MDVAAFVIVTMRLIAIAVIMTAARLLSGGEQIEKREHREAESADQCDEAEVGREVLHDPAAGMKVQQGHAP